MMSSDQTCKKTIDQAFSSSWSLINTHDKEWTSSKATTLAFDLIDKVEWKLSDRKASMRFDMPPRIFRVTATLPGSVAKVAAILRDINNTSEWNKALQLSKIVKHIDRDTIIAYQITSSNGQLMFQRDYVMGLKFGIIDGCFVAGGCSLDIPSFDATDGEKALLVRAFHFPGCIVVRPIPGGQKEMCTLHWLLDSDYGGLVPNFLSNSILPLGMIMTLQSLRQAVELLQ